MQGSQDGALQELWSGTCCNARFPRRSFTLQSCKHYKSCEVGIEPSANRFSSRAPPHPILKSSHAPLFMSYFLRYFYKYLKEVTKLNLPPHSILTSSHAPLFLSYFLRYFHKYLKEVPMQFATFYFDMQAYFTVPEVFSRVLSQVFAPVY